ncbi:hypothetical protein ASPBRDRAFT_656341 [Aspergillus brasiliensis CBS 101740]|uniref:Nucleoside phosphorylase domain-containing protein n=1 Tax=Aspergillus brasiliensis (strain CBS 101740 / IMI 381727 / IBT 21946) TaxID=767769 RepID=A0A1L9V2I8_ASPBC|nr:hypothetical protein ASPBRDRAFT_656341 [Aspergillus brasiliensis CBS 101740]
MVISKSKIRLLKSRPLCIICAKPQEVQIVARTLQITKDHISSSDIPELGDGYDFYLGTFNIISKDGGEARSLEYYVTSPYRQGIQTFSIQAGTLFHVLRPQFAVHAGVCAGYAKEGIKLEDVIFGDMAINYEEGKWVVEKGQKLFKPSYRTIERRTVVCIVGFTQSSLEPTYKYGGYISGSAVREDANEIFDLLRTSVSLTSPIEMEWAMHALRNVEWNTDEDDSIVAEFVNIYYENFVRIALDAVGSKQDLIIADDNQRKVQSKDVKGMKVVMPENDDPSAYSESGHIAKIANDRGLESVTIGQNNLCRGLLYKDGYLIDFPRLLNKFADEDRIQQAKIFQKLLLRKPYFTVSSAESTPLAATATWEDFVKFAPTAPN